MMGRKVRQFGPLERISLEQLVPRDHFYRQLDRTLDLAFVRDLVRPCYAAGGRPSIDPVVFFRLMLLMFLEGIRSERQLMRRVADSLSARWYCGYDLHEALPDHSSLTRIRARYGLETFRRFFDTVVEQCQAAGLVWGVELYIEATKVVGNAALESLTPRFAVAARAHVDDLFFQDADAGGPTPPSAAGPSTPPACIGPAEGTEEGASLAQANAVRHDWLANAGRQDRSRRDPRFSRSGDRLVSTTDPDATYLKQRDGVRVGYQDHYVVDGGRARIILTVLVTPAEVMEDRPALDLLWHTRFRWQLWPRQAAGDKAYGTLENIRGLEEQHVKAYLPLPDFDSRTPLFGKQAFRYDPGADAYTCPGGATLRFARLDKRAHLRIYRARAATCNACPLKARCTAHHRGRSVSRHYEEEYLDRVRAYQETEPFAKARRKRSVWVEPLFAEAKDWHGLRRFRLRRLWRVNSEVLRIAAGQNLKRLLARRGWGRRPFPGGAPGLWLAALAPGCAP